MTRTSPPQVAMSSGEIGPLLHRRFDYQRFQTGLAACRGFLPMAEGVVTRAPGTWYRGGTRTNQQARLVPFIFAANDAVVLEFTPNRMRVWRYGSLVMAGPSPFELVTPFGFSSLASLRWVQSADVLYLVDGINPVQRLSRLALDNWTISAQTFDRGPFRVENLDKARTIQASAATGTVTLTASSAFFTASHVGTLLRLRPSDLTNLPQWQADEDLQQNPLGLWGWPVLSDTWTGAPPPARPVYRRYDDRVYRLTHGNNSGINPPIHDDGEALTDNVTATKWLYVCDNVGIVRITAIISPTQATATVLRTLSPAVIDLPSWRWSEGAWSTLYGYPRALELYEQRLVAAATPAEPRSLWFSAVGGFSDFLDGSEADDAFGYTIAGNGSQNGIQNIFAASTGLHILALGEEYSVRPESRGAPFGAATAVFTRDSGIGASPARPIGPSGGPIFISRDRRRVMSIAYSLEADANRAIELSRPARHFGAGKFEEIVWQGAPMTIAWLRTAEGPLAAMIYDPAEEVLGWATLTLGQNTSVVSLCVTPSVDGSADTVTLCAVRGINGSATFTIEELALTFGTQAEELKTREACHLYAAKLFFFGAPPQAVCAMPHLPNETVTAWTSEGNVSGLVAAPDGTVTLPWPVEWAVVGIFDPTHYVETLDVTAQANDGATMGRRKRLQDQGGIGLYATHQLQVQSVEREFGKDPVLSGKRDLVPASVAAPGAMVRTGIVPIAPPTGQATEVAYRFTPVGGSPATLTAIIPHVQEAGR